LTVDAGCRQGLGAKDGAWNVFAGFALGITTEDFGTVIERASYSPQDAKEPEKEEKGLRRLEVSIPITVELVGQELFVFIEAGDNGNGSNSTTQYHFDNVRVIVED
jgi:hypothetical protein